ncbi:uncharacterized protein RHOBADRAFT_54326 [Rhodotorula graminis WP1]|uniref:Transmembrane protein n=1 Tax=Rhodotorula graminis (strain WP1) TaxID=578459 RepID=A0A194S1C1_RHOGW|nr:uncharacterized protein RHOBADRAFT_54326 [Rhodotorula graminis WP1]KPV74518.1 hypothetical protein RHOBADRAFT_54326 [Rhodotorula graminis WP1]
MAADEASVVEGELQKVVDRIAAQERLPTLQSDLVLLAVISILLGYFIVEQQRYWTRFPNDHVRFKLLAAWLAFLEAMFFAIRFAATWITTSDAVLGGAGERPGFLTIWSTVVTTLIEATVEGFFVWRLWTVTKKWWMRYISVFLWAFSFVAHAVWVGKAGAAGRSNIVDDADQLVAVITSFWGTFAEGTFVALCLLYELQFAEDRKIIKRNRKSTAVGRLFSLAMRTSGILVVFELIVAIAVTIQSQPRRALLIEVEFAACIYTVLAAIIVLFTLNWRATIRAPGDGGLGPGPRGGGGGGAADDATRGDVLTPTFLRSVARGGPTTTFEPGLQADEVRGAGEGEAPVEEMDERPARAADEAASAPAGAAVGHLQTRDAGTTMRRRWSQDQPGGGGALVEGDDKGEPSPTESGPSAGSS